MKNKLLKIISVIVIATCLICGIVLITNKLRNSSEEKLATTLNPDLPINYMSAFYAYSFATPEEAIGSTDYAFVAKINSIKRTDYRNSVTLETVADGSLTKTLYDPYTIYDVTVIENIKGELTKTNNIELEQTGGLERDKKSYTFLSGMGLLNVGEYYIILATSSPSDGTLGVDHPNMVVPLGNINDEQEINKIKETSSLNSIQSINNVKAEYSNTEYSSLNKVLEYKDAYLNQKIPVDKTETVKSFKYDVSYQNK